MIRSAIQYLEDESAEPVADTTEAHFEVLSRIKPYFVALRRGRSSAAHHGIAAMRWDLSNGSPTS